MTTAPGHPETIVIKGMTGNHCVQSVTAALTKLGGLADVQVDPTTGRVSYTNVGGIPRDRVAEAVRRAGFAPQ